MKREHVWDGAVKRWTCMMRDGAGKEERKNMAAAADRVIKTSCGPAQRQRRTLLRGSRDTLPVTSFPVTSFPVTTFPVMPFPVTSFPDGISCERYFRFHPLPTAAPNGLLAHCATVTPITGSCIPELELVLYTYLQNKKSFSRIRKKNANNMNK